MNPGGGENYGWLGSFYPNQCAPLTGQCVAFPLGDTTTDKASLSTPPLQSTLPALKHDPALGQGVHFVGKPSKDPMIQTWGLEIQRQLPGKMMISAGYVGTHGTHLFSSLFPQLNYVSTANLLKYRQSINEVVPITDYYSGQTAQALASLFGTQTLPRSVLLKPYPFFNGGVWGTTPFDGTTIYHALNLKVQKRYSYGLNFIAAYTFSKQIDNCCVAELAALVIDPIHGPSNLGGRAGALGVVNGQTYQDPDNKRLDRAVSVTDIPHMFNLAATYELPFGSGRHFLNKKGALNHLIGGWLLTGNFNAQSGLPLPISCPADQIQAINGVSRCDLVGNPNFSGSRSKQQQIAQWFNPAAFEPAFGGDQNFWANYNPSDPRAWQFGTMGQRMPSIRGPGFWNTDASLSKQFHFTENKYFEFRWEVFNALNHMNPGEPNTSFCLPPVPDGTTDLVHQAGCAFGRITNIQTDPRAMEFALKFFW